MLQPNLIYYASSTENLDGIFLAPSESYGPARLPIPVRNKK